MRPSWRSAAPAGRNSAQMASGSRPWRRSEWTRRRCARRIVAFWSTGRSISGIVTRARRSTMSAFDSRTTSRAARRWSPGEGSKAVPSMRCPPTCARRSRGMAVRRSRSTCDPTSRCPTWRDDSSAHAAGQSIATRLRKTLKLAPAAIGLLHEAAIAQKGVPLGQRDASGLAELDPRGAGPRVGSCAARSRDLHGGRRHGRSRRRRFHAAREAGHLRGRRDARLGGADRRLPAPGLFRHGRRRGSAALLAGSSSTRTAV